MRLNKKRQEVVPDLKFNVHMRLNSFKVAGGGGATMLR